MGRRAEVTTPEDGAGQEVLSSLFRPGEEAAGTAAERAAVDQAAVAPATGLRIRTAVPCILESLRQPICLDTTAVTERQRGGLLANLGEGHHSLAEAVRSLDRTASGCTCSGDRAWGIRPGRRRAWEVLRNLHVRQSRRRRLGRHHADPCLRRGQRESVVRRT